MMDDLNPTSPSSSAVAAVELPKLYDSSKFPEAIDDLPTDDMEALLEQVQHDNSFLQEEIAIFHSYLRRANLHLHSSSQQASLLDDDLDSPGEAGARSELNTSGTDTTLGVNTSPAVFTPTNVARKRLFRKRGDRALYALTVENKLEIATREMDDIREEVGKLKTSNAKSSELYRARLKEADLEIEEIEKDNKEFQRDIVVNGVNPRTSKIIAEKILRYFDDKLKAKESLIEKLRLKNTSLKSQIMKSRQQLKSREEKGEELTRIDFDQLKIENEQYVLKIDEKSNELLRIKSNTGNTLLALNALMDKLNALTNESQWLKQEIDNRDKLLGELKREIEKVLKEKEIATRKNSRLRLQHEQVKVPEIMDYINVKALGFDLRKAVESWERKVEIAEANEKICRAKAKKNSSGSFPPISNSDTGMLSTNRYSGRGSSVPSTSAQPSRMKF